MDERAASASNQVVIAEDKDIVLFGLRQVISDCPFFHVAASVTCAEEVIPVVTSVRPAILLIKDRFSDADLGELIGAVFNSSPETKVAVLLSSPELFWVAVQARAHAFCSREISAENLLVAMQALMQGRYYIDDQIATYLLAGDGFRYFQDVVARAVPSSDFNQLSTRQKQVLNFLADGMTNEAIAESLGVSIQTVKVHVRQILKKLNVADRTQAAVKVLKSSGSG